MSLSNTLVVTTLLPKNITVEFDPILNSLTLNKDDKQVIVKLSKHTYFTLNSNIIFENKRKNLSKIKTKFS
jgi:hypothetical protein